MTHAVVQERVDELIREEREVFISILPPSDVPAPLSSAKELIESVCARGTSSLEIVGTRELVTFGVRDRDVEEVRGQLEARFPQAQLSIPGMDPILPCEGEKVVTTVLTIEGDEPLPLRTFDDEKVLREGSDPLLGVAGAIQSLQEGERVLVRVMAKAKRRGYFEKFRHDALPGPGGTNEQTRSTERNQQRAQGTAGSDPLKVLGTSALFLGACVVIILGLFGVDVSEAIGYLEGITSLEAGLLLFLAGVAELITFFIFHKIDRWFNPKRVFYDPKLIADRVDHSAYDLEIQIVAFVRDSRAWRVRAQKVADVIAKAYGNFDHPQGSSIVRRTSVDGPPRDAFEFISRRRLLWLLPSGVRSVIGSRELSGLWHLPATGIRPRSIVRSDSRRWPVEQRHISEGAPVGSTTAGGRRVVRISEEATRSHQFCLAKSGMGKTTYMTHLVHHAMQRKALGENPGAIVVIDPHGGLVDEILSLVPPEVAHQVRLLDLNDESRVAGINVLSPDFSLGRDATAGLLVRAFASHWEFWGPNMQDILSHSVKTLYEANAHADTMPENAYTLLDARHLWFNEAFRRSLLEKVKDEKLKRFWLEDFPVYERGDRAQTLNPIANRLREYDDSEVASAIIGQRFSTIDLKASVRDGNILLVSTAAPSEGEQVANLLGSYLLLMIDQIIRSQSELAPDERPRVMVVVDEMETISGAPYEKMLNEWRKFGGSLVLATQTLAGIREMSPSLETSLLTNVGVLVVFRVGGKDADTIAPELGAKYVSSDDIVSLDEHHAYVRMGQSRLKLPPFSMEVLPPVQGSMAVAYEIRARSPRYTQSFETVYNRQQEETLRAVAMNAAAGEKRARRR